MNEINCKLYYLCNNRKDNIDEKLCVDCNIQLGPHNKLNEIKECNICLVNKNMIQLKCN